MNANRNVSLVLEVTVLLGAAGVRPASAQQCSACHATEFARWGGSPHANTQTDVANELSQNWAGLAPDDVIHGPNAEDCLACHAPTVLLTNGGMSELQALGNFFTTINGQFSDSTSAANTSA